MRNVNGKLILICSDRNAKDRAQKKKYDEMSTDGFGIREVALKIKDFRSAYYQKKL